MNDHGFFRIMTASPQTYPGDISACVSGLKDAVDEAVRNKASLLVLPELCVTSASCGDLFRNTSFLRAAEDAALGLAGYTAGRDIAVCFSFPLQLSASVYSVSAIAAGGKIIGIVPLGRHSDGSWSGFSVYDGANMIISVGDTEVAFGNELVFCSDSNRYLSIGIADSGSSADGASVTIWPEASREMIGRRALRRDTARIVSAGSSCVTVFVSSGSGESTADGVFSGHALIAECGAVLAETEPFGGSACIADVDLELVGYRRNRKEGPGENDTERVFFSLEEPESEDLRRYVSAHPFMPEDREELRERCRTALEIQSRGLAERLRKTGIDKAVLGISGGLDSTLALLASVHAMEILGRKSSDVIAVSMPCFGTSARTRTNAERMCGRLGVDFRLIDISKSVESHLKDIGHDLRTADTAYENAQARERTQVLMDISNMENGLAVGTGDMSEAALGWCTFNGDHMSMYNVNCSIPKTFIREMVSEYASACADSELSEILMDVVATPISPELKPAEEGKISQKTEEIIGPYDVHDFFLYNFVRNGACPDKLLFLAERAFGGEYEPEQLRAWLEVFMKRFFSGQFKRSCAPDGPVIGMVNLSSGGFGFPSDLSGKTVLSL